MEEKIETKKSSVFPIVLVILVILVILVGACYWWIKKSVTLAPITPPSPEKPAEEITPKEDSVSAINQDLEETKILDLEQEFQEIDQDLNSL
jgi:cell division protein YceG involved in septum cleavage